jgi:hypothetical protein
MSTVWNTKWGPRRVRKEPPTMDEALIAAEAMTSDPQAKIELAASLIGAPIEDVKAYAATQAAQNRGRSTLVAGRTRAVVVEYKRPRMFSRPTAPLGRR